MAISVKQIDLNVLNMRTRMPFRYGIASLVALPHLFLQATVDVNGRTAVGHSSDGLPPKWFTKYAETSFGEDLEEMLTVIRQACALAQQAAPADTVFDLWWELYTRQKDWAAATAYPPLLWGFGVSLVERAVIDAFCRCEGMPFFRALRENTPGIRLGEIHGELADFSLADLLPAHPNRSVIARQTIGLTDPLTDGDIPEEERLDDGLPQSLEASLRAYGLTHLKIKLFGDAETDSERLKQIADLMARHASSGYAFTLDWNEQYTELEPFRVLWESILADASLAALMEGLLFVEQPLHRDVSLGPRVKSAMQGWPDRPPLIIDESDATFSSVLEALDCGYVGTSHKNCKGVFKGIANACLLEYRRRTDPGGRYILSSEDLANVGPVALFQDLAVALNLGLDHVERNGHHYFAGLSMYPEDLQVQVLSHHGTLYRKHERGFPALDIRSGRIDTSSVVDAPFGYRFDLDTTRFTPLEDWTDDSLEI